MKKKLTLLFICLSLASLSLQAQTAATSSGSSDQAFAGGTFLLSPGIGIGNDYGYIGTFFPALSVSIDDGLKVNAGPGTIGIGGIVAFKFGSYDYSFGNYSANYSETYIAVRGTYHWTPPGVNGKLDLYAGIPIGVRIDHYSEYDPYSYITGYDAFGNPIYSHHKISATATDPFIGLFVGASYYFNSRIGVFGEVGYTESFLTIGLNFKLK